MGDLAGDDLDLGLVELLHDGRGAVLFDTDEEDGDLPGAGEFLFLIAGL
jgi:hypothetical protein